MGFVQLHYRYRETVHHITLKFVDGQPEKAIRITVEGVVINGAGIAGAEILQGMIPLVDDRRKHHVEVILLKTQLE